VISTTPENSEPNKPKYLNSYPLSGLPTGQKGILGCVQTNAVNFNSVKRSK